MEKMEPMFSLRQGKRYRWRMRNASDDIHPMHLHRHSFELTKTAGKPTAGLIKDVVMLGGYQEMEVDFTAENPGLTFFHCHMQLHSQLLDIPSRSPLPSSASSRFPRGYVRSG
jgi:FtsP/CotA-like multicopper oxidase with cupredoxin domain